MDQTRMNSPDNYDEELSLSEARDREFPIPPSEAYLDLLCRQDAALASTDELVAELYRLRNAQQPFEIFERDVVCAELRRRGFTSFGRK